MAETMKTWNGYEIVDEYSRGKIVELEADKAEVGHKHSAADIESGTFGVVRGGTGKPSHTSNSILTGNGSSAIKNVPTASGAFYATADNAAAKFGVLPVAQGGTGQTTIEGIKNAIGFGENGVLPITSGGTGATTAEQALSNLGGAPVKHGHSMIESDSGSSFIITDDEYVDVKADTLNISTDVITINGREYNKNQIMWQGALYFNADQVHEFINGQTVNGQPNGIVLVFSYYIPDAAEAMRVQDDGWSTHFVPKSVTVNDDGENISGAHTFLMVFNDLQNIYFGMKQLYINNHQISGCLWNDTAVRNSGSLNNDSGITFNNDRFVLRYVIGV